jgi:hypothetical protein
MRGSIVGMRPAGIFADLFGDNEAEAGEGYGAAVAIADVGGYSDADGYADLIVGVPGQDGLLTTDSGRLDAIFSDHTDPWFAMQSIDQASFGMSTTESGAFFGGQVTARTFGSRGVVAAGTPFDDVTTLGNAGSTQTYDSGSPIDGGFIGLGPVALYTQDTSGMPDAAEANDFYGADTSLLDVDGDGLADVVIGSPGESINSLATAGSIYVERDVTTDAPVATLINQNSVSVAGAAESGDRFGASIGY